MLGRALRERETLIGHFETTTSRDREGPDHGIKSYRGSDERLSGASQVGRTAFKPSDINGGPMAPGTMRNRTGPACVLPAPAQSGSSL